MILPKNFYKPIDILKTGESGNVQLVYDRVGKQVCVMKQRQLNSADVYQKLRKIKSRYIPEIFRMIEEDENFLVVEEYVSGRTLAEILLYEDFFHEDLAAQIMRQLCECLQELHAQNIIHRDIKPSNIMLTRDNVIRLIDFSISRIVKEDSDTDTEFLGTRGYAPPEQYGFGQTDERSDIYSLGVTIKRILGKNYSGWLEKILERCTKIDPTNRYQNVDELLDDFDRRHWQNKFRRMKKLPITAENESEVELTSDEKFDEMLKHMQDIDAVTDNYFEEDPNSLHGRLLERSLMKIVEDFEKTVYSITEEDFNSFTPEERAETLAELEKTREELEKLQQDISKPTE